MLYMYPVELIQVNLSVNEKLLKIMKRVKKKISLQAITGSLIVPHSNHSLLA